DGLRLRGLRRRQERAGRALRAAADEAEEVALARLQALDPALHRVVVRLPRPDELGVQLLAEPLVARHLERVRPALVRLPPEDRAARGHVAGCDAERETARTESRAVGLRDGRGGQQQDGQDQGNETVHAHGNPASYGRLRGSAGTLPGDG